MSLYSKWARKEHPFGRRVAATLPVGLLIVVLIPWLVITAGAFLDRLLGLPSLRSGAVTFILGGLLVATGMFFGLWSNYVLFTQARGTPLPIMPSQELMTKGPFAYCRNPMTFGTILVYLGVGVMAGTLAGIGLALCFGALLGLYLKRLEEKELAERFGEAYLAYKREVPFIIPRFPKRK